MTLKFGPRRGTYIDLAREDIHRVFPLPDTEKGYLEEFDLIYRTLCSVLFNFVPTSGHPGGSISSGRIVTSLLFQMMDIDLSDPNRMDSDMISYAAGHKALGLYAMWALRNEIAKQGKTGLLPQKENLQMRMEDLLGFRRNPITSTPLFRKFNSKPLDGHPTPATPFVKLSTGASGVGLASSIGLGFASRDYYGQHAPKLHIIEGEGGLTPGRAAESMAAAATAGLDNITLHLDWNQASIDSDFVTREGDQPGDYVQWDPVEFGYLQDWNVVFVPDGKDFHQVLAGQKLAMSIHNGQPTMIVYRTIKGWSYGIEGKASHGGGHAMCSPGFYQTLEPLFGSHVPGSPEKAAECKSNPVVAEEQFWQTLTAIRAQVSQRPDMIQFLAGKLQSSKDRLDRSGRKPRAKAPQLEKAFAAARESLEHTPEELELKAGSKATLRGALGNTLNYLNEKSQGALLAGAADLLGSTSVKTAGKSFPQGYLHAASNPESRILSIGGICEDGMSGVLTGVSAYGAHIGVCSSYAAFMAPLGHIASRLHAIGNQAKKEVSDSPYTTFILLCAHAGLKTGEDGPTHADPQSLQVLQEAFPKGTAITLTPWDPQELWPLMAKALCERPAIVAPFVTRPSENILDRQSLGLAPVHAAQKGVYKLLSANGKAEGTLVLQGSEVAYAFLEEALPLINKAGMNLDVYYVSSVELFETLPDEEKESIFSEAQAADAMGITGFTLPTMFKWVTSTHGRKNTMYPFKQGHYLGSGQGYRVVEEAGLHGTAQFKAIETYLKTK
ncbi:MAG: hypothetical protein CR997_03855 [Acidobacteria bacterium]|nr:MAG: hypothetical protein CR997_03855 [Acidobacteriota bacterium]